MIELKPGTYHVSIFFKKLVSDDGTDYSDLVSDFDAFEELKIDKYHDTIFLTDFLYSSEFGFKKHHDTYAISIPASRFIDFKTKDEKEIEARIKRLELENEEIKTRIKYEEVFRTLFFR